MRARQVRHKCTALPCPAVETSTTKQCNTLPQPWHSTVPPHAPADAPPASRTRTLEAAEEAIVCDAARPDCAAVAASNASVDAAAAAMGGEGGASKLLATPAAWCCAAGDDDAT